MATTTFKRDWLGRKLVNPGTDSRDHLGRATTSTLSADGQALYATAFPVSTAVTVGQVFELPTGQLVTVTVAGTTAGSAPAAPGVGSTVASNTATVRQDTTS